MTTIQNAISNLNHSNDENIHPASAAWFAAAAAKLAKIAVEGIENEWAAAARYNADAFFAAVENDENANIANWHVEAAVKSAVAALS